MIKMRNPQAFRKKPMSLRKNPISIKHIALYNILCLHSFLLMYLTISILAFYTLQLRLANGVTGVMYNCTGVPVSVCTIPGRYVPYIVYIQIIVSILFIVGATIKGDK